MAKRFTDTEKWKKPFIRTLKAPYKLLWLYILDECDHAGIWQVDLEVAQIKIGEKLNLDVAIKVLAGKIFAFDRGTKWFIPDFLDFQYGYLNPENRAHNSVLKILDKYDLVKVLHKPLASPSEGAMDKDKDKDMDMDMDKDKGGEEKNVDQLVSPFPEEFLFEWIGWKDYKKKEHRFGYKTVASEQGAIDELAELSNKDPVLATSIIKKSIANGWKGFFPLKNQDNGNKNITGTGKGGDKPGTSEARTAAARQF